VPAPSPVCSGKTFFRYLFGISDASSTFRNLVEHRGEAAATAGGRSFAASEVRRNKVTAAVTLSRQLSLRNVEPLFRSLNGRLKPLGRASFSLSR